ncbi:DNA topoisomerase 2-binding protein 1-like [Dreissena polymorpha]|uniref:DNA topoisomerase 2-binding protein 1-like n=1 Tax=Dreissena polymorpha TaxID=45954 RepID=UPI002263ABFB|nr:DNA topoisomerase 2-binding protein 1-like [Dreissena polymorpha]
MCMEQNALLDVDSNPLFTPIEINMEGAPLKDCVLSISGYSGTERDILISIAEVLGATCQGYFVRTAKNNLLPSTHLVVNAAEGSKYEAAKKWGIPALSKLWILSCARQGKKVPEDKYLIEIVSNDNLMSQVPTVENQNGSVLENRSGRVSVREANQSEIGQQNIVDSKEADGAHVNKSNGKITDAESNSGGTNKVAERKGEKNIGAKLKQGNNEKVSAVGDHGFSQTDGDFMENNDSDAMLLQLESQENYQPVIPVVETELKTTAKDREVKPASTSVANNRDINVNDVPRNTDIAEAPVVITKDGKALNKNLLPATKHVAPAETPPFERLKRRWDKNPPLTGTPVLTKQSAKDKLKEMPARKHNWRYDDWVAKNDWTAKNGSSQKENLGLATSTPVQSRVKELKRQDGKKVDIDTPSKFLNPNVRYIPKFETEEFLASLQTPEDVRAARAKRKPSLNDSELFELMRAKMEVTIEQRRQERESAVASSQRQNDEVDGDYEDVPTALQGVVITVARRLAKDQAEFNEIVTCLGGEYRWTIDNTCTHFIFQGRQNDTTKDFKQAKAQGLKIVSPHWLYMCKEQNARVDESLFPHTFNPNLSLAVVTTRGTPMRTPRVRRNIKSVTEPPKSAVTAKNEAEKTSPSVDRNSEGGNSGSGTPARKGGKSPVANLVCKLTGSLDKSPSEEDKQQPQETVGSLEMREVLSKQLEDVMAQNTGKRRRRGSKRLNCSGQVGTPEDSSASSGAKSRRTEERVAVVERNSAENQPSQSVHVVWDDPIRRSEQEKLAHQLARANSPTQDVPDDFHEQAAQFSETDDDDEEPKLPVFEAHVQAEEAQTPKQPKSTTGKTPTPDPPSIAFPVGKAPKVTPPQPIVLDDDNDDDEEEVIFKRPPPVFIMSGIEAAERDTYGALVEQLGGRVIDAQQFDIACTHLVIDKITRNEKFLACLASGKWILHKSYFNACREEGQFVKEDFFEWGGEGTLALVKNMDNSVRLLAAAAREWRIKLSQQRQVSSTQFGAFSTWRVILICEKGKVSNFIRLLTAGGATVLNMRPPFPARVDATHVLMEPHKIPVPQEDLEKLLSSGCLCLKPEYISGYLCNPESDVAAFTPPEIQALLAAMSDNDSGSKKRKCSTGDESQKRTKRR